jgi:hypothetical protein
MIIVYAKWNRVQVDCIAFQTGDMLNYSSYNLVFVFKSSQQLILVFYDYYPFGLEYFANIYDRFLIVDL